MTVNVNVNSIVARLFKMQADAYLDFDNSMNPLELNDTLMLLSHDKPFCDATWKGPTSFVLKLSEKCAIDFDLAPSILKRRVAPACKGE